MSFLFFSSLTINSWLLGWQPLFSALHLSHLLGNKHILNCCCDVIKNGLKLKIQNSSGAAAQTQRGWILQGRARASKKQQQLMMRWLIALSYRTNSGHRVHTHTCTLMHAETHVNSHTEANSRPLHAHGLWPVAKETIVCGHSRDPEFCHLTSGVHRLQLSVMCDMTQA